MAEARGNRKLKLERVAIWANQSGVFLGSTDPDVSFIVALHGKPEQVARQALARFNRTTD